MYKFIETKKQKMVQSLHPFQLTLLLLFTSNFLQFALGKKEEEVLLPPWPSTYNMSLSTIIMPCNYTGYMDAEFAAKWGLVDFDWSNGKQLWANAKPMNCQELLVDQVKQVKAINPSTKTFVYRNLVKALPWYTDVRLKLDDPQYSGWFLKFRDDGKGTGYFSNPCTEKKCSIFYHDQDQTPEHPHGDGSCKDECDCGTNPCGEYLWDHRNSSLRSYLINEFVLGPDGVGNQNIDGVFLDDAWHDKQQPHASWWPKVGFCSADKIGGPTEEYPNCTLDMGLTQQDTIDLTAAWKDTISEVQKKIVQAGGFNWQLFTQSTDLPSNTETCIKYFQDACQADGGKRYDVPWVYQFTDPDAGRLLPNVTSDLATFLLARGDYAWIGYGWIGCAPNMDYYRPKELDIDYGKPINGQKCALKEMKSENNNTTKNIFVREYTKATISFDCDNMEANIIMRYDDIS